MIWLLLGMALAGEGTPVVVVPGTPGVLSSGCGEGRDAAADSGDICVELEAMVDVLGGDWTAERVRPPRSSPAEWCTSSPCRG